MSTLLSNNTDSFQTTSGRREFVYQLGAGIGCVALSWLLDQEALPAGENRRGPSSVSQLQSKPKHFRARAKAVIFFVMEGGPSQIDTFDPKSSLERLDGKLFARDRVKSNQVKGKRYFVNSPFKFRRYGQCGMQVSELFQEVASCVDDMAFVRSVHADSDNHPAALFQYNTGYPVQGNPSVGSWVAYGLGTENQNLPAFVVLRDGKPYGGTATWGNAYLPSLYQGTQFRSGPIPVLNLQPPAGVSRHEQRKNLDLIQQLNRKHQRLRSEHSDLEARIAAYELAFRMQAEIPEAIDIGNESAETRRLYGLDQQVTRSLGTRCLLARRFIEQGVRFVQVWSGGWDSHGDIKKGHANAARKVDRPIAGLLKDLKQRGLLEETLVVWGGEFGRTPDTNEAQFNKRQPGRDHNPGAMTMWFAGGGVKGGTTIGATDEVGGQAVESRFHLRDVHATLLRLLGLDQTKLTYYHGGRFKRLTDNGGNIIYDLMA